MTRNAWRYVGSAMTAFSLAVATPMAVAEAITQAAPVSGAQANTMPGGAESGKKQQGAENSPMSRAMVYSLMGASLIVGTATLLGGRREKRFAGGD